jgi:hypothetical protein
MKTLRNGGQAHGATVAAGLGHHVCAPLSTPIPTRSTGSHQQSTATLSLMSHRRREGQSAKRMVGEKRLVKGTFPHVTPFVSRRPLTRPRQPTFRRTLRPASPAQSGRHHVGPTRRHHPHQQPVAPPDAFAAGQRLVHRSAAPLRQASVGSGSNHPRLPPTDRRPHSPPAGPTARHRLRHRCPGPSRKSSAGVTQTTPSTTHPVHLWLFGRAPARVGVRGVAGMALHFAADLLGLAFIMAAFRRRSSWR